MYGFADSIRVQGCTLGQCTRNLSGWQHHGTIWQGAPVKETKAKGDNGGSATISDEVASELKKVQSLARSLQSQHDRNQNYMDRIQRDGSGGGKGGGKSFYDNNIRKGVAKVLPKGTARDMVTGAQRGPLSSVTLTRGTIDLMSAVGRKHRPRGQLGKGLPGAGNM